VPKITAIFNSVSIFETLVRKFSSDRMFSEILTGSAFALAGRVVATALTLAATVVIARFYGAESVGVLAVVNAFLTLITIFTVLGTGTSILRLIPEHVARHSVSSAFGVYRKIQYLVTIFSVVSGTVFFFASDIIADKVFSKPQLSFFFALASVFVIFKSLMDLNTQAVRGLKLIRTFAIMQVMPALVMLVVLLAGTLLYRHPNNPVYAQLAAFGITAVIGAVVMHRAFKSRMQADDAVQGMSVRDILSISTPMLMTASMNFFIGQTGVILLGMYRTASEVGYYSIAVKLATLTAFVLQAINSMAAPKFSELYHSGKTDELFHVARKATKLIFWTTAPILVMLIALGKPILLFFFGEEFTVAYPALVILVVGQFVNAISGSTGFFMNMTGHHKAFSNIISVSALLNGLLSIALINRYGINGVAFAGMISLSFWNIYTLAYIKNKLGRSIGYMPILRP
jgi:O-antigen/teichoic acid export membrane protein